MSEKPSLPTMKYHLGSLVARTLPVWKFIALGENEWLRQKLDTIRIDRPIYVTSLARSGTTILLEILDSLDVTVSRQYRDYPYFLNPVLTEWIYKSPRNHHKVERAHKDGIRVNQLSPEAMEEPIWRTHFPASEDSVFSRLLDGNVSHQDFEGFYQQNIKKLLVLRHGTRYLCKGNYNIGRIRYLKKIFPDALFVIPVRHPLNHIASLAKQHQLFTGYQEQDPRLLPYLNQVGHNEFGLNRRVIFLGDPPSHDRITQAFSLGNELMGWSLYWSYFFEYVLELKSAQDLKGSIFLLRYEDLVRDTGATLKKLFTFLEIKDYSKTLLRFEKELQFPDYYQPGFSDADIKIISKNTRATAAGFGYASTSWKS
jgi:hypothetical protein